MELSAGLCLQGWGADDRIILEPKDPEDFHWSAFMAMVPLAIAISKRSICLPVMSFDTQSTDATEIISVYEIN